MLTSLVPALALTCGASLVAVAAPAAATTTATVSPAHAQAAPYAVTIAVSRTTVEQDQKVAVTGRVLPRAAGDRLVVQSQYAGTRAWRKVGTATVRRTGRYRFVDTVQTDRSRSYRVVKPAGHGLRKGTSKAVEVTVYAWRSLTAMPLSASSGIANHYQVPINGTTYGRALLGLSTSRTAYAEFTLGRRCTSLRTTIGLTDRTASGGTGSVTVTADGSALFGQDFALGTSVEKTLPTKDVYRLRVDFAQTNATPTEPALGEAEVLCTSS